MSIEDDIINKEYEQDHMMVTQSGDPNNKSKPAYKKDCSYCHKNNHSLSNCYQKQRDEEYQRYKNPRSKTPQQSFVQYFRSKPNNTQNNRNVNKIITLLTDKIKTILSTMIDIEIMTYTKAIVENIHKTIIDRILNKDIIIDLEVHIKIDLGMIITIKEELHPDLHIDRHIETTLTMDTILDLDHSQSQGNSFRRYNYPYRSESRPRDYRSQSRTPSQNRQPNRINQVDIKPTNDKDSTKFEIHTCQVTEIANTTTPYSWFYPLYIHATEGKDNTLPSKLEILFLLDTKGPINPLSHNKCYIHVINDAFSHFVVTVPFESNNAKTAIKTLLHHWIIKFGPAIFLSRIRNC